MLKNSEVSALELDVLSHLIFRVADSISILEAELINSHCNDFATIIGLLVASFKDDISHEGEHFPVWPIMYGESTNTCYMVRTCCPDILPFPRNYCVLPLH